jgi:hypothetical protein
MEESGLLAHVGHAEYLRKLGQIIGRFDTFEFELESRHLVKQPRKLLHVFLH